MENVIDCGFVHTTPQAVVKPPVERDCGFAGAGPVAPSQAADQPAPADDGKGEAEDEAPPSPVGKRRK